MWNSRLSFLLSLRYVSGSGCGCAVSYGGRPRLQRRAGRFVTSVPGAPKSRVGSGNKRAEKKKRNRFRRLGRARRVTDSGRRVPVPISILFFFEEARREKYCRSAFPPFPPAKPLPAESKANPACGSSSPLEPLRRATEKNKSHTVARGRSDRFVHRLNALHTGCQNS